MNSRAKGCVGEREWRDELRKHGYQARRGQQFSGHPDAPDVVSELDFHFEVKRVQNLNVAKAVDQAMKDSGGKQVAVAHRKNNQPWLVTMLADAWFELIKRVHPPKQENT
jgi:Holliday junction resolvase